MTCNIPEPCKFPSLDSCRKRFLWAHREVDLAPHPVIGLVLQSFLRHLVSKAWIFLLFFQSVSRIRVSQPWRRTEVTRDLYHLNLLAKLMVLHHHILFSLVLLPLLRQSCCRFLLSRCHPCTGLLPGTCTWSPPLNFGPFMLISMLMLFVLLVISLLSMLTCIPYAMGLSMSLLVRS